MNKKNLLVKIVLAAFVILLLISLIAPAVFPQRADIRQPRQETLLNGLKVIMFSDPRSDRVSLKLRINSGSAFDPQGKEGVMKLLSDNIFPNDEARNLFAEELGGSLAIDTNYDYIQINATARPDQFLTMRTSCQNEHQADHLPPLLADPEIRAVGEANGEIRRQPRNVGA